MSHAWTHSWCKSPSRDEAVRAAEDGRQGPLPTLEEAIAAVTDRRPPEPGGGGNVTGLRTERVTLEVTHDLDAPLGKWIVQVLDESLGYDETVRVVDNTAERITQALAADRFASAVAEVDRLRARVAELESAAKLAPTANADGGSNHAAPAASGNSSEILTSSPAASGAAGTHAAEIARLREERLTAGEREALELSLELEWPKTARQWKALAACLGPVCVAPANEHKVAIRGLLDRQPLPPGPEANG